MQQDVFLGNISGWKFKKIFFRPALELFHCLPLWTTVRLYGKKLQNATNDIFTMLILIVKNSGEGYKIRFWPKNLAFIYWQNHFHIQYKKTYFKEFKIRSQKGLDSIWKMVLWWKSKFWIFWDFAFFQFRTTNFKISFESWIYLLNRPKSKQFHIPQ